MQIVQLPINRGLHLLGYLHAGPHSHGPR